MKHHRSNINSNTELESFVDYDDELDLLDAVSTWWRENEKSYSFTNVDCINISFDDGGCQAEVFWTWLTPEMTKHLDEELKKERPIKIEGERLGKN